jgi:hypothetical protein
MKSVMARGDIKLTASNEIRSTKSKDASESFNIFKSENLIKNDNHSRLQSQNFYEKIS